jgi:hypothetical protein
MVRVGVERRHRLVRRWSAQTPISVKAAAYAWRHFVTLMEALPADQAAPLWQMAQAKAVAMSISEVEVSLNF